MMKAKLALSCCSKPSRQKSRLALWALALFLLPALAFTQPGCVLITDTAYTRPVFKEYRCRATLVDATTGENRMVSSAMLEGTAPGAPFRYFFDSDWDGTGTRNDDDVVFDWRRYLANDVVNSTTFADRSWCLRPSTLSCERTERTVFNTLSAPTMADHTLLDCPGPTEPLPHLLVTAPGLTPDYQLSFPDTPVGNMSAPVTFTVTNVSTVPLRVNGTDLLSGAAAPNFVKSADTCLPTPAELVQGRGHLLGAGLPCTFQLQFQPQHRDGVVECDGSAPNESCRRRATLFVTGETDTSRRALTPINVGVSGRAIGGGIITEPTEICFPAAPPLGSCTPMQMLRIRNTSTGDLTLTSARLTRAGNRFDAPMPFLMPFTLPPGLPLDVSVRFCNVANDPTDGEFTINSSSPTNPTTVVRLVNPLNRTCP